MNRDKQIIFVICYALAAILIYKLTTFFKKKQNMELIKCSVTDTTYKTGYKKNTYIYYYKYTYKNEEYSTNDTTRFKVPGFNPQIKDTLNIYINPKKPNKCVTPLEIFYSRLSIFLIIVLIILPLLIFI